MSEPRVEIPAMCEVHGGSGRLVVRRDGDRIVLGGNADDCSVFLLEGGAVTLLFDVLGEWLG
jgi:hypothetical protein